MIIAINGQNILSENPAGPEKYSLNLIRAISKINKEDEFIVYTTKKPSEEFVKNLLGNSKNIQFKKVSSKISWTQCGLAKQLIKDKPDVFFSPVHTIPIIRYPKTKYIGMIHGLEYTYSHEFKNIFRRFLISKPEWFVATFANKIVVPSIATKTAILEKWSLWVNHKKIFVVHEGVDEVFREYSEKESEGILKQYGVEYKKFLIFVSTIQPRKNLPNLVQALSLMIKEKPALSNLKLLVCGKKGWDFEESLAAPEFFGIPNNVIFAGRVPDTDLPILMSGAAAYVNASFEEGFGLPLLEAMAAKTLPIISNILAHKELSQENAFYFDPYNPENIKNTLIEALYSNPIELSNMIEANKLAAERLTWEKTAKETLAIIKNV